MTLERNKEISISAGADVLLASMNILHKVVPFHSPQAVKLFLCEFSPCMFLQNFSLCRL